ncbi:MAG: right-handed parallel beta-helix repeat-containing protein [Desulfuromonadales bacterium]|nr:right-handed parallel beta-helix repeat-containing protein [Desulfuromonadales bacterium]
MKIYFCNGYCRLLVVSFLTLSFLGCSGLHAPYRDAVETVPEQVSSPPSAVPAHPLSHHSPPPPIPTANALSSSLAPSGGGQDLSAAQQSGRLPVVTQSEFSYENATLTEDITWRGSVLVRGYLVIAPQATVKIEPGTVVRFMKSPIVRQLPRLVVLGRIDCRGLNDQPVLFTPNSAAAVPGEWGGILLLSSEKRNHFEHVRIEGAKTGVEARFSTLSASDITITRSLSGMLLRDSMARLVRVRIENGETALEAFDSEVELRESTFVHNRRGISARRTTLALQAVSVRNSEQQGVTADECHIKFNSCEFAENGGGGHFRRAEGQISRTRFVGNRGVGLELAVSRLKIQKSLFADTVGDGIRIDDGQSVIWESAFEGNSGHNMVNSGSEIVSAVQNWWGTPHETAIAKKLFDEVQDPRNSKILFFPWLPEKPAAVP